MDVIKHLLARRGAELCTVCNMDEPARQRRAQLTRMIGRHYTEFEALRNLLRSSEYAEGQAALTAGHDELLGELIDCGIACDDGGRIRVSGDEDAIRFITGGWLEELCYHAALEAGAEKALVGQKVRWKVQQYNGMSEIDVIARKRESMVFVSCKSVKSALRPAQTRTGQNQRKQLMTYLNEADNIVDHFGMPGDVVALVVTTDLIDEMHGDKVRYSGLFGKALRLDVELIPLEQIGWEKLIARFQRILNAM